MTRSVVAVTGATGYLGSLFMSAFVDADYDVVALTRREPSATPHVSWRAYELGATPPRDTFEGVDVLVHAAWDLGNSDAQESWARNVGGSRRLLDAAREAGVARVVFVSSMSAYFGTRQTYGISKLAVERTVLDGHGVIVRPGLVYGDNAGGMAGTLTKIASLPVWPKFGRSALFLAHSDDVATGMVSLVENYDDFAGRVVGFAHAERVDLTTILASFAPHGKRHPTVPVPASLVMSALRLVEATGASLPFRSDSLLGLVRATDVLPGQDLLANANIRFRPLAP